MDTLITVLRMAELLLLAYLLASSLYFLFFALAASFYHERSSGQKLVPSRVLILLPAYKEDAVILETAEAAARHISARHDIQALVLADSLRAETVAQLRKGPARVLEVAFANSTKAKSIRRGLETVSESFDYVVILDADNVMAPGCVDALVERLQSGYRVVQGQRTAKNINTDFAILDGISEGVNNAIFRTGHRVVGLSASLIGSGFACELPLFRELMARAEAVGGFDKELELFLLSQKITIGYARKAVIYDEKIQQADAFVHQRRRWLSAQLVYFSRHAGKALGALIRQGKVDYFDKVVQFVLPPRVIALGLAGLPAIGYALYTLLTAQVSWWALLWWLAFLAVVTAILISIPAQWFSRKTLRSLLRLPQGFWLTLKALFRLKGANKKFIHTEHGIDKQK